MMTTPAANTEYYEIRLKRHLDARWANWFEGMTITLDDSGDTLLSGEVVDQAALRGANTSVIPFSPAISRAA